MYDYFLEPDFFNRCGWNGGVPRNFRSRCCSMEAPPTRWCPPVMFLAPTELGKTVGTTW